MYSTWRKSNNNQSILSVDITSLDAPSLLLQHAALVLLRIALVHCHGRRTVIFAFVASKTDSLAAYSDSLLCLYDLVDFCALGVAVLEVPWLCRGCALGVEL
jgi:hypothetical protein